jgi:hypothetical protein
MNNQDLIQKALNFAGYECAATEENLINCFLDYVDAGVIKNLDWDEAKEMIEDGEISIREMARNLIIYCGGR